MKKINNFTSKDLMESMKLQVGDRVKVVRDDRAYEIVNEKNTIQIKRIGEGYLVDLSYLVGLDIEILPRPKRIGNLKCNELACLNCPLCWICFIKINEKNEMQTTLYEMLESFAVKDQEIYDLLKTRLDKEVD